VAESSGNPQLRAIVVGSVADSFVRDVMGLLDNCRIGFVRCDDVYSAVGESAGREDGGTLLVGRLGQFSREGGRFFRIAHENGHICCCLVDGASRWRHKEVLAAMRMGAYVISEPAGIGGIIEELLTAARSCASDWDGDRAYMKDEFRTTEAELDALLDGGE
jgi:hypothetical protein